jgi:hypothetical protein
MSFNVGLGPKAAKIYALEHLVLLLTETLQTALKAGRTACSVDVPDVSDEVADLALDHFRALGYYARRCDVHLTNIRSKGFCMTVGCPEYEPEEEPASLS